MQKKYQNICTCQKKAVLLQSLLIESIHARGKRRVSAFERKELYRGVEQW